MKNLKLFIPPILLIAYRKIKPRIAKKNDSFIFPDFSKINSYSQFNEDLIIDAILNKEIGFYVDVGANDPSHLSNTKRFYDRGWHGINIEPQSHKINDFEKIRKRDINLNLGIGETNEELDFYELKISTLSSFNYQEALNNCKKFNTIIKEVRKVKINRLDTIFDKFLPPGMQIDFLSIDTEGFEMEVLKSNDWLRFKPLVIIIEFGNNINFIHNFLIDKRYCLVYRNSCNLIYKLYE